MFFIIESLYRHLLISLFIVIVLCKLIYTHHRFFERSFLLNIMSGSEKEKKTKPTTKERQLKDFLDSSLTYLAYMTFEVDSRKTHKLMQELLESYAKMIYDHPEATTYAGLLPIVRNAASGNHGYSSASKNRFINSVLACFNYNPSLRNESEWELIIKNVINKMGEKQSEWDGRPEEQIVRSINDWFYATPAQSTNNASYGSAQPPFVSSNAPAMNYGDTAFTGASQSSYASSNTQSMNSEVSGYTGSSQPSYGTPISPPVHPSIGAPQVYQQGTLVYNNPSLERNAPIKRTMHNRPTTAMMEDHLYSLKHQLKKVEEDKNRLEIELATVNSRNRDLEQLLALPPPDNYKITLDTFLQVNGFASTTSADDAMKKLNELLAKLTTNQIYWKDEYQKMEEKNSRDARKFAEEVEEMRSELDNAARKAKQLEEELYESRRSKDFLEDSMNRDVSAGQRQNSETERKLRDREDDMNRLRNELSENVSRIEEIERALSKARQAVGRVTHVNIASYKGISEEMSGVKEELGEMKSRNTALEK